MIPAINSALSGLAAASKRLEISANNLANQSSTREIVNGQQVNQPYTPQRVDEVSLLNGGVLPKVRDVTPASFTAPDLSNPGGTVELPNVDVAQELVNQQVASYDFKANLKSIKVADDLQQSLLDILS